MARLNNNIDSKNQKSLENRELKYCIKPGKKPYFIFFFLFFPFIASYVYVAIFKNDSAWSGAIIFIFIMLSFHLWIYSQTIVLLHDRITYSSWFFRKRTILLKGINKWSVQIGINSYWDRLKPTVRLEIHAKKNLKIEPLIIPLKLFNQSDLKPLFDRLPAKLEGK